MKTNFKIRLRTFFYFFNIFITFFIIFISCDRKNSKEAQINAISVDLNFERFDLKFYNNSPDVIPKLKKEYPFLFPTKFPDSVWIKRQNDSLQLLLQDAVKKIFNDINPLEGRVSNLFKHIKYYFPRTKTPQVITLTNNVDYQIKTVYSDSLLLISLDTFLGSEHPLYEGIPSYIRKELDKKYIISQIAEKFSAYLIRPPEDRTFLAQMVYEGKKLYLQDMIMPNEKDAIKIAYSKEELDWAKNNEIYIWQFFIEKQLLYKTDSQWSERFIEPAPFSKFYLQLDNESPGRIGRWIGWQIVRSFHKQNPNISLQELIKLPFQQIFNKSKYKPKR
ncbi:MAG: gliding motility lipoprotein GldB [Flavobacteriaceae bacterium TMED179]|nr:MAG: gliding motility lipoprotein GldB [Flavobacteriaceae bacterium TMED179]|tara:strand:- start:80815 stop:81813 length:999 start_codon:yes stop_codon:yes gene_type:complete